MDACPACGREVVSGARFCAHCGEALLRRCTRCGAELVAGARFCTACGAAADPTAGGERRHLTVVFCDLVASTELAGRLDPEDYTELIQAYQERVVSIASGYAATVESFLGDGILMRFGWPEAHDDDPERAVRASLEAVEAIQALDEELPADRRISVRIGIHTGPVVIDEVGAGGPGETMAIGETLNLAARLQEVADPDTVVMSEATVRLVRGLFVTEDLGSHELKGIRDPVHVYRAVQPSGVRSRLDAARDRLTRFIGRRAELALLEDRWQRACSGSGQGVLVTGHPGVGKSRLVYELRQSLRSSRHTWLECHCSSYTERSAFRPAIELIEQGLQLQPGEPDEVRLEKLERAIAAVGIAAADALPILGTLLAIPGAGERAADLGPELRRRRTIEILAEWVLALARLQPLVLLVEDLHWCDPSSLELFSELIARSPQANVLLLGTARIEFAPEWGLRSNLTTLAVNPFADREIREMVEVLSGGRQLPDAVVERIVADTDGIPLYAEEIGRMILESSAVREEEDRIELVQPLSELDIPTSLQGSLIARLDRISSAKRVAQLAAVIGREFGYGLLQRIADLDDAALQEGLARLAESEIVIQHGEPPQAEYTFRHALIQDAAYQSLLKRTRRQLHERVARELEANLAVDPLAHPERVARHYEAAGLVADAIANYRRAATQAKERSGHREAIDHLRRAIALSAELPPSTGRDELEIELQMALGAEVITTRSYADPDVEAAYARARTLCEGRGEDALVGQSLAGLSIYYLNRGQMEAGAELAGRVLDVAERLGDDELRLLGHVQLALPLFCSARFAEALDHARSAIEVYDPDRHHAIAARLGTDQGVAAHCFAGQALMGLGLLDQALAEMRAAVALARSLGHHFSVAYALLFETTQHWVRGDRDAQRRTAEAVLEIAEPRGFEFWQGLGTVYRAAERALRTRDRATLEELIEGASVAGQSGNLAASSPVLACVAEAQLAVGDFPGARVTAEGALAMADQTGQPWWDADLLRLQGLAALGEDPDGGRASAERHLTRALALAGKQGIPILELRAAVDLARLVAERGDAAEAARMVADAYSRFDEGLDAETLVEARELVSELDPGAAGRAGAQPVAKPSSG